MANLMQGKPLPIPKSGNLADQCREMGLAVGDVIQGREEATYREGGFHETRLKVLWLGQSEAVLLEEKRSDLHPDWSSPVECSSWTLDCRRWWRVGHDPVAAPLEPTAAFRTFAKDSVSHELSRPHPAPRDVVERRLWAVAAFDYYIKSGVIRSMIDDGGLPLVDAVEYKKIIDAELKRISEWHGQEA